MDKLIKAALAASLAAFCCTPHMEPYRVDLGGLSVVVLDSANACDQGNLRH